MRREVTYCRKCGTVGHKHCSEKTPIFLFGGIIPHIAKRKPKEGLKCSLCQDGFQLGDVIFTQNFYKDKKIVSIKRLHLKCYTDKLIITSDNFKQALAMERVMAKDINKQKARGRYVKKADRVPLS